MKLVIHVFLLHALIFRLFFVSLLTVVLFHCTVFCNHLRVFATICWVQLLKAATHGHVNDVSELLAEGASIEWKDPVVRMSVLVSMCSSSVLNDVLCPYALPFDLLFGLSLACSVKSEYLMCIFLNLVAPLHLGSFVICFVMNSALAMLNADNSTRSIPERR